MSDFQTSVRVDTGLDGGGRVGVHACEHGATDLGGSRRCRSPPGLLPPHCVCFISARTQASASVSPMGISRANTELWLPLCPRQCAAYLCSASTCVYAWCRYDRCHAAHCTHMHPRSLLDTWVSTWLDVPASLALQSSNAHLCLGQ